MMSRLPRIGGPGAWPRALLGAGAVAVLAAWWWPIASPATPDALQCRPADLSGLAALDSGDAVRHPVFDPERRSWTAGGSLADVLGQDRPSSTLVLRGIAVDERAKRALIDDGTSDAGWLTENEGRGSWRILRIEPERIVVADAGIHYTLEFLGAPVRLRPAFRLQQ